MASSLAIIAHVSKFGSDAAGLEKTLRLLQALAHIAVTYVASPSEAIPWLQARKQFALGRRYLRFFRFGDAIVLAQRHFNDSTGLVAVLEVGKWSCLGMYLLLESCTIMDAMEIWNTTWGPTLLLEANRFWFYSLVFSLIASLIEIFTISISPSPDEVKKTPRHGKDSLGKEQLNIKGKAFKQQIMKKIFIDGCDLFIPGHITGWMMTSPRIVGMATVVSTTLGSGDIWKRLDRNT